MSHNLGQFIPQQGMDVYGSDGDKIGAIDSVEQDYFVVRKGFFFPEDHYIPVNAVATYDDAAVYLTYTKEQVLEQQWTTAPGSPADGDTSLGARGDGLEQDPEPFVHEQDTQATHVNTEDDLRVDLHEEDLVARRREVDRGAVRIEKEVVAEEQSIDVPVTEERVEVTRRAVDRDVAPGENAFEEGTIEVPVHGEEVDIEKRSRVTEEIDVDTVAEQHTERVSDTVRREEVRIEGDEVDGNDAPRR